MPRLRTELDLPYYLEQRSKDIIEDWQRMGMPAIMPQSIAAVAFLRAYGPRAAAHAPAPVPARVRAARAPPHVHRLTCIASRACARARACMV